MIKEIVLNIFRKEVIKELKRAQEEIRIEKERRKNQWLGAMINRSDYNEAELEAIAEKWFGKEDDFLRLSYLKARCKKTQCQELRRYYSNAISLSLSNKSKFSLPCPFWELGFSFSSVRPSLKARGGDL